MNKKYLRLYVNFLSRFADFKKPLKAVFDCSNGPAGLVLKKLRIPNARYHIINSKIDGRFPAHDPNPLVPGATEELQKEVRKRKADLGVIFDGDGDRAFFVDNRGRTAPSHLIAYLLFLNHKPPYVADIFTFKSLEYSRLLPKNAVASKVGTYFMKRLAKERRSSVGAEQSGHYYFKDFFYADSGLVTAIKIMNAVSRLPVSLADFCDSKTGNFHFSYFNLRTSEPLRLLAKINKRYGKKAEKIQKIDGLTFNFRDWFLVVRPSNTEPLLRFFIGGIDGRFLKKEEKKLKSKAF